MRASSAAIVFGQASGYEQEILAVWNPRLGCWTLPGGKAEAGEDPFQTMKRELMEETGAWVEAAELHFQGEHTTELGTFDVSVFLVGKWSSRTHEVSQPHPKNEPNAPVGWLTVEHFLQHSRFARFYSQFLPVKRYE